MLDLIEMLTQQAPLTRIEAAEKLAVIGPAAKDAVPALIAVLDDIDANVRGAAAIALGCIGPDAHDAVDKLIVFSEDPVELVRWAVSRNRLFSPGGSGHSCHRRTLEE